MASTSHTQRSYPFNGAEGDDEASQQSARRSVTVRVQYGGGSHRPKAVPSQLGDSRSQYTASQTQQQKLPSRHGKKVSFDDMAAQDHGSTTGATASQATHAHYLCHECHRSSLGIANEYDDHQCDGNYTRDYSSWCDRCGGRFADEQE